MRTYHQLTSEQRYQISALKRIGHSRTEIVNALEVHKSTISRELSRNQGARRYPPNQAHEKALERRTQATPKKRILAETWKVVEAQLRQDWSPEQISGWLLRQPAIRISPEWIYQHILTNQQANGDLHTHLRQYGKQRKLYGKYDRRGKLPNRVSIEDRPPIVEQRECPGHWEVDTLVGKEHCGALASLVERKSRYTLLQPITQRFANLVVDATISLLQPFIDSLHTITGDNGKEFAEHVRIAETLQADFYFAHPYSAWERGTNENTNGLVRQYFPKKTDFSQVTLTETDLAMDKLNHRPRKCLDFKSPFEVFFHPPVALLT